MKQLMILGAVFVVITTGASAQDLYKCKTPDGRTVVSNAPCAVGSNETVIPSAVSSTRATPSSQPATDNPTVDTAFKALRKIMAATEVGINMRDYGQLVVEAKAAVNDITLSKDASLRKEIETTMQAYTDALTTWNLPIPPSFVRDTYGDVFQVYQPDSEGFKLHIKYHFTTSNNLGDFAPRKEALTSIWTVAKTHLTRATDLAK